MKETHIPNISNVRRVRDKGCALKQWGEYPRAQTLRDLDFAVDDAELARTTLEVQMGFHISAFLTNDQVTKTAIEGALSVLMHQYSEPTVGRLFVMFVGHGVQDARGPIPTTLSMTLQT